MSLIKKKSLPLSSSSSALTSSKTNVTRKKALSKPGWDTTNSNLEQYKPSTEELERRRQSCQSKNIEVVKSDKQKQSILKSAMNKKPQLDSKTQLAIMREILLEDEQLKGLLYKSDATLKNAANLFGDSDFKENTKKQAKINFTSAPNADQNESNLPMRETRNSSRGANTKVMINKNLNSSFSNEENSDNEGPDLAELIKYRQLLIEKQRLLETGTQQKKKSQSNNKHSDDIEKYIKNELSEDILMKIAANLNLHHEKSDDQNNRPINDTVKVNRVKSRLTEDQQLDTHRSQTQMSSLSSLNDFKKVLQDLENQLVEYEDQSGRQQSAQRIARQDSFSSYTISLVNVVSSLLHHLKQTTLELNAERQKLSENNKQLDIHRKLIDGLTNEILSVKMQNEKILSEFATNEARVETEMDQIKMMLKAMGQNPDFYTSRFNSSNEARKIQASVVNKPPPAATNVYQAPQHRSLISPAAHEFTVADLDRFSERLNAMLQTDVAPGSNTAHPSHSRSATNLYKQTNMHYGDGTRPTSAITRRPDFSDHSYQDYEMAAHAASVANSRPTSAPFHSLNKQMISEFNSQIHDLSQKNFEAHQKLKTLQQQQQLAEQVDNEFQMKFPETMQHLDQSDNQRTLNKLKEDQMILKDQINMLNKQRELAQQELEVIVHNGVTPNANTLNSIGIGASNGRNRSSPNISPIPTQETNFNEIKWFTN